MSHDLRCEHSRTRRCRCDCRGAQHGSASTHETGSYADEQTPARDRVWAAQWRAEQKTKVNR
jgi:hypothetical protein